VSGETGNPKARHRSLRTRFLIIVCAALLPVAALSVWQGVERIQLDEESVRETLRQSALSAASDELNVFTAAEQLLRTLAMDEDVRLGRNGCQRRLADAVRNWTFFPNIARVSSDGTILCAVVLPPSPIDVTKMPWWKEALVRREFLISGPIHSDALKKNVVAGVLPLAGADGAFDGTLNAAINIEWLTFVHDRQQKLPRGALVALFDKSGTVVASNAPVIAAAVFEHGAKTAKGADGFLSGRSNDEAWSLAIAPVLRHDYYIGFAMRNSELFRVTNVHVTLHVLLPVLMLLFASLALWLATDLFVVRWIDVLRRMAAAYAGGHYALRPQALNDAPSEFRELGNSLSEMAQTIQERDRKLREALTQKEILIKELHHRVKNTLQTVMSLLRLQAHRLRDVNAREAMEQARARINALALAHRTIYDQDLGGSVDLKPLLAEAVAHVQRSFEGENKKLGVSLDVAPCQVSSDTAIPLMLFVNEAMTNAFAHAYPEPHDRGNISVSLRAGEQSGMDLVIADDGRGLDTTMEPQESTMGVRLMRALAKQLSGEMSLRTKDGGGTIVTLHFAPPQAANEKLSQ